MSRESEILAYRKEYKYLFKKYLNKYIKLGFDKDDLKSEMDLALIKAYDHFDKSRGVDFGLCLSFWVKEGLMRYTILNKKIISPSKFKATKKESFPDIEEWKNFEFTSEGEAFIVRDFNINVERSTYENEVIHKFLKNLSGNELKVAIGRLKGETIVSLSKKLGKSKEWIRQLEMLALNRFTNKQKCIKLNKKGD